MSHRAASEVASIASTGITVAAFAWEGIWVAVLACLLSILILHMTVGFIYGGR